MKRYVPIPAAVIFLAGLSACSSVTQLRVDAAAKPAAERSVSYRIETNRSEIDRDSLHYREAERLVKTAMSGKGFYEAGKSEKADMVILLDYGMSEPKITREEGPGPRSDPLAWQDGSTQAERNAVYVVTYEKYLKLTASETRTSADNQAPAQLWTVDVITEGQNRNLRQALPALAAATIEFVGVDSHGEKIIRLKDKDPDGPIAFVKRGM